MRQFLQILLQKAAEFLRKILLFVDDLLIIGGISVIIWTNFRVNELFGWYSLGLALVAFGWLMMPDKRKKAK